MKCFVLKTIILGDCGVGKTTMLYKYYNGNFNSDNQSTVGVNFVSKYVKNLNCEFSDSIKIQIWDTAGQERFRSIIRSYYRNICGCIIAYDITNKNTFNNSLYWMDEVRKNNKDVVLILVGTKNDLEDKREIDYEDGVKLSNHYNIPFFEISSKTKKIAECTDISHRSKPAKGWMLVFFICVTTRPFLIVAGHLCMEDDLKDIFLFSPLFPLEA